MSEDRRIEFFGKLRDLLVEYDTWIDVDVELSDGGDDGFTTYTELSIQGMYYSTSVGGDEITPYVLDRQIESLKRES